MNSLLVAPNGAVDYGFLVDDFVEHVRDNTLIGIVVQIDSEHDLGGVTTCRVVWGAKTVAEAHATDKIDQDIQWTNKLVLLR